MTRDRTLPTGDYAYVAKGSTLMPCAVVGRRGRWFSTVLAFRPYHGTERRRVRTKNLLDVVEANRLLAFRDDPMALLHMHGREGDPQADEVTAQAATSRADGDPQTAVNGAKPGQEQER